LQSLELNSELGAAELLPLGLELSDGGKNEPSKWLRMSMTYFIEGKKITSCDPSLTVEELLELFQILSSQPIKQAYEPVESELGFFFDSEFEKSYILVDYALLPQLDHTKAWGYDGPLKMSFCQSRLDITQILGAWCERFS